MKTKVILFPCHPINKKEVDPDFLNEFTIAKTLGFTIALFDYDSFVSGVRINITGLNEYNQEEATIIYRGWMLKSKDYSELWMFLKARNYKLINNFFEYINCHHFPRVYNAIKEYSPKATWFRPEAKWMYIIEDMNCDMIMKDYVKSNKRKDGISVIKKDVSEEEFKSIMNKFIEERGNLFNHGIVLKEFVNLKKYNNEVNEFRTFVIKSGDDIQLICSRNSNIIGEVNSPSLEWIKLIANRIKSNFFTIDVAEKENGEWIVVETGDGQVSGLSPNQNSLELYNKLLIYENNSTSSNTK